MQIAIDGPAGSGKSTISKILADRYGFVYLDTGAMYRAAAWYCLKYKTPLEELANIFQDVDFNFSDNGKSLTLYYFKDTPYMVDITKDIRTPEVTGHVSIVAAVAAVRTVLTEKQQKIAESSDVIMDGRDIGTTVLPNAEAKFFLLADPVERARRRALEWGLEPSGEKFDELLKDLLKRDEIDSGREVSPLKKADDAIVIDTTHLTIDQVVDIIDTVVNERRA